MHWVILLVWIACLAVAVRLLPAAGPVRRRLLWLSLLAVPWGVTILGGPFVIDLAGLSPDARQRLVVLQQGAFAVSAALPFLLLPFLAGARGSAAAFGVANVIAAFLVLVMNLVIIDPGS